jgi:hypothetical protein
MRTKLLQLIPQTSAFVRHLTHYRMRFRQRCKGLWHFSLQARYQLDIILQPIDDTCRSIYLPAMSYNVGILTDDATLLIMQPPHAP